MGLTSFEIFGFPPAIEDSYMINTTHYFYPGPITLPISYFAYTSSIFASLFLTIERYLAICRQISISLENTKMITFSVILICAMITSPFCFFYTWKSKEIFSSGNYTVAVPSEFFYTANLNNYWMALDIILFVIPLMLFLVFNILIIKKVRKSM